MVTITPSIVVLKRRIIGGYMTAVWRSSAALTDRVAGSRAATQLRIILTLTTGCSRVFNANYVFIITTFITNL